MKLLKNFPNEIPRERPRANVHRAHDFVGWILETVIGFMLFVVLFGSVGYKLYSQVDTSSFDQYTLMFWGFLGMIVLVAFFMRVVKSAQENYSNPF